MKKLDLSMSDPMSAEGNARQPMQVKPVVDIRMLRRGLFSLILLLVGPVALGGPPTTQIINGKIDDPSPVDQPESPDLPVPFISGDQEAATFHLPPGFVAECVAQEPLVEHPVALAFDPDGKRIWVCEMRGYMPDFNADGEDQPTGRISVLQDTDGDGKMDKSTVFLDHLVLPRAVGLARDGVLLGAPPLLLFCRDTNGDGKSDQQTVVADDYGDRFNPENQANGLMYGLDNWIYSAAYGKRFRNIAGQWISDVIPIGGQFGITQDDFGHQFFNTNSNYLRGNLVPAEYTVRNPAYRAAGANVEIDHDQACWPSHPAAINRGYRKGDLRDGRLRDFTAACSPCIYRGGLFGDQFDGNAFVCEATSNFVRRSIIQQNGNSLTAHNAYNQHEFLASDNERFRPVNLYTGPDGALWVVDMAQGILQHKLSLTNYLKNKYHKRELDEHRMCGRIFRIYREGTKLYQPVDMTKLKSAELVALLSHPNGWWRDTAQRLLVERNFSGVSGALKEVLKSNPSVVARIHALWTLEGMRRLDPKTARAALSDSDARVRAQAIRATEFLLNSPVREEILPDLLKRSTDDSAVVRLQFALTMSAIGTADSDRALVTLLGGKNDIYTRDGAISGLRGRELDFLKRLLADPSWSQQSDSRPEVLSALANGIVGEANPKRVDELFELVASQTNASGWRGNALAKGMIEAGSSKTRRKPIMLASEPAGFASVSKRLGRAAGHFVWPGKPGYVPPPPPVPLNTEQQARFELGRQVYMKVCIQCHKPDGMGLTGLAPPLAGSEWVLGPDQRMARIVLSGLRGPVTVNGQSFNLNMPSLAALSDEQIAGAMTFVRRSWENDATPVEPQTIAQVRTETHNRIEAWTEPELLKLNFRMTPAHPAPPPPWPPKNAGAKQRNSG
jgi:mono/diheme cytochrome c family protein